MNSDPADRGFTCKNRSAPLEMIAPLVEPWVEQSNHCAGNGITSRYVRAFVPIAMKAGESEIVEDSRPSMLPRDDVVYVKRPGIHGRRQMAVVATAAGASTDFTGQFPGSRIDAGRRFLSESDSCLRLHDRKKIPHMQIAVELCFFFGGQVSALRSLSQIQHSSPVFLVEIHREKELCSFRR